MLSDHLNTQTKRGVRIVTSDAAKQIIEGQTQRGEVTPINAFSFNPAFRWPIVGENWIVREENGSWYLESIWEQQTAPYPDYVPGAHYEPGAIVKFTDDRYYVLEASEKPPKATPPPPGAPWKLFKVPQVKAGDSVITASSGRILQNKSGIITEVPNGLRVPWFPTVNAGSPDTFEAVRHKLEQYEIVINDLRAAVFAYNMVEAKGEVNPEGRLGTKSGAHLDSIFGEGTGATFAKRVDLSDHFPVTSDVTEYVHPKGFSEVRTTWADTAGNEVAKLRMHMYPDRAHFASLIIHPDYQRRGFNRVLVGEANAEGRGGLGRWLRTLGIKIMTAQPDNAKAEQALALIGWHWQEYDGEDLFALRLDQRDRMDEYREWLEAGSDPAQEPEWRKELRLPAKLL